MYKIAVQLYTVREEMKENPVGTLEKVAELGYKGVEFAGFFNISAEEMKGHLERLGLTTVASHTPLEALENQFDEVIRYNKTIGNRYLVCPWSELKDKESLQEISLRLKTLIPKVKAEGMELLYHNHDHELKILDDNFLLDKLVEVCDGELGLEVDTFWVYRGGVNPRDYMLKHEKHIPFVHVKDGTDEGLNALGEGKAPVAQVLETVEELGLEWIIVENDNPYPNGLEDIERSMVYLQNK